MIETRIKQIFDYLTLDYNYHTSKEIGEIVELSSKTIRKEINHLNSVIKDKGAMIESKTGKGFIFKIINKDKFTIFLKNDWYKYAYFQQEEGNKDSRYENILRMFLFSNSYIKQHELAESFYVSKSQINKDLPIIRKTLDKYNLKLVSKPYHGMKIVGSEKNIRLAIKNEIGEDPIIFEEDKNKKLFNKIQRIIDNVDFGDDYYMPYVNFKNLVIHIYISILRIKEKKYINLSRKAEKKVISYEEFNIACKIVDRLQSELQIEIPSQELVYITMHLIAKNTIRDQEKISTEILELSQNIIDEIYNVSKYDFRSNIDLYFALATHLGPLINRISYGFNMKNPILSDIKDSKIPFNLATIGSNIINEKYRTKISEDEIGYIALHIMAAINNSSNYKKNILIVCGSGNSSAQIMKSQLNNRFRENINSIVTVDLKKIDEINVNSFDIILSSVELNNNIDKPIIRVDILFTENDFNNIKLAFKHNDIKVLDRVFDNSIFIKGKKFNSKIEILTYISLIIQKKSNSNKDFLGQLIDRERMGTTEYEGNIAIPHILESVKSETFLVIIILDNEILWDRKRVNIIMSLVLNEKERKMENFYYYLGLYLSDKQLIKESKHSKDINEFKNIFMNK